jgi:NAD(P)-dependent dehydrogenase (short-subunit alcohol dehydrogenase family)
MGAQTPVADLPDDQFALILDTNLKGPLHCARRVNEPIPAFDMP